MSVESFERVGLVHQADRIERLLSSLDLPAKIQGGQVGGGRIRYFLTPTTDFFRERLREMTKKVADEMGVYHAQLTESDGNLVLDIPMDEESGLRLLTLLESLDAPPPLTSIIGLHAGGEPFKINFRHPKSRSLIIAGRPGTGKSEFLRSVLFSIAFHSRQTQVNFLAIDLSGNELSVVEALPHGLAEVATEIRYGVELIQWLIDEIERREVFRIRYPELFLIVDDVDKLVDADPAYLPMLERTIREGKDNGVHVVATAQGPLPLMNGTDRLQFGVARAEAIVEASTVSNKAQTPGNFRVFVNQSEYIVRVAWMPAFDLQEAVSLIQSGKSYREMQRGRIRWS